MADRHAVAAMRPSTMSSDAAAGPAEVVAALQLLLQVEYLQSALYASTTAAVGLVPATDVAVYTALATLSNQQRTLITEALTTRAVLPTPSPTFDFTVKGAFPGFAFAAGQYATLQMLSQIVEDLGVRTYLGQLGVLSTDKAALTTALAIFTVKGRRAAEVRRLRGKLGWVTGNSRDDLPAFAQPVYDGEENVQQGSVNVVSLAGGFGEAAGATQAFDEPLASAQVAAILALFIP